MPLPDFFIIGAPKCGTTALYHCTKQHPEIFMCPVKEPHFFTFNGKPPVFAGPGGSYFQRVAVYSPEKYLTLFSSVEGQKAIGEASPSYLRSTIAAERIKQAVPTAKIIVLIRQPADRAYSQYQYLRYHGVEPASTFYEALSLEKSRISDGWSSMHFHREGGYYFSQLQRYYDLFPHENIKIYLYEDWNRSPYIVMRDLFNFLGVDDTFTPKIQRSNVTLIPFNHRFNRLSCKPERIERLLSPIVPTNFRSRIINVIQKMNTKFNLSSPPPIDPEIRRELTEGYREDILKTQKLIGRDLSHWFNPK